MFNKKALKSNILFFVITIIAIVIIFAVAICFQDTPVNIDEKELDESGELLTNKLIITEIMTSNKGAYADSEGNIYDWVEIYNGKDTEVNLKNYALSDNKKKIKWVFPEITIEPKAYLIVNLAGLAKEGLYANFKLKSAGGEDLILVNASSKVIDAVTTIPLGKNEVMYRDLNGTWQKGLEPTPGYANTKEGLTEYYKSIEDLDERLIFTEVLPRNKGNFLTKANDYFGFVEITNNSEESIELSNYTLGNSLTTPFAYELPSKILKPGESIAIFTSGKNRKIDSEYHASFKLNSENGVVVLTKNGKVVNKLEYSNLPNGIALSYIDNTYEQTSIVSPGYTNNEAGIDEFSKNYIEKPKTLIINEVMNYNQTYLPHNGNSYYDWIELYNNTDDDIDLDDYYLTTNTDNMIKYQLPKVTLRKGEYYLIMASGDPNLTTTKYKHANFKISDIESLYLTNGEKIIDSMFVAGIPKNYSFGRGEYGFYYYEKATPNAQNGIGKREISYIPLTSTKSGIYDDVKSVSVSLNSHGTIYYTLDGSKPTTKSKVYSGPISLTKTTVLKAISLESGKYQSPIETYSYIINEKHTLDVLMISMEPSDYRSLQNNREARDNDKKAYAELYEQDGDSFKIPCEVKLFGGNARKAGIANGYVLKFKHSSGEGKLNYQVFESRDYSSFDTLLLKSGTKQPKDGDNKTPEILRDILATSLMDGKTSVLVQAYHPVILYINGKYIGLYNIRERVDEHFIQNNLNVTANDSNTNIVKIDNEVRTGSRKTYSELLNYLNTHNMSTKSNYEYIKKIVNVRDIADHWIAENYTTNNDIVNVRYYQSADFDDNRWHAIFFDLDNAWKWYSENYYYDSSRATFNGYSTAIIRNLLKNNEFRTLCLERISYQLKYVWNEERVLDQIDYLANLYGPEIERHYKKYGFSPNLFKEEVAELKRYAKQRNKYMISYAKSFFKMTKAEVERYFGDL